MTLALVCEKLVWSSIHNCLHPCVDNAVLGNIIRQTFMLINQSGVWDLGWAWRLLCQWLIAYWCPPHSPATSFSMPLFTHFNMLLGLLFSKLYFFIFFHFFDFYTLPPLSLFINILVWVLCVVGDRGCGNLSRSPPILDAALLVSRMKLTETMNRIG